MLFKLFNKIETWELLREGLRDARRGGRFDLDVYDEHLLAASRPGQRIYSAAYVMPPPKLGAERKHPNHLRFARHDER